MLSTDRDEFEAQLRKLCAGFNVPPSAERSDAYWIGLERMSLVQFVRCVDDALGEHGQPKMPTTHALWAIHKSRRRAAAPVAPPSQPSSQRDNVYFYAYRLLLVHITARGGVGQAEMSACMAFIREFVREFSAAIDEGDELATPAQFVEQFAKGIDRISPLELVTKLRWSKLMKETGMKTPFRRDMALALVDTQELAL